MYKRQDADCVGITGSIPWSLNRQWADVVAESGTSLFVSAKPGVLTAEENEELHQIMLKASRQDHHKIPLDWEETDCPEVWGDEGNSQFFGLFQPVASVRTRFHCFLFLAPTFCTPFSSSTGIEVLYEDSDSV